MLWGISPPCLHTVAPSVTDGEDRPDGSRFVTKMDQAFDTVSGNHKTDDSSRLTDRQRPSRNH